MDRYLVWLLVALVVGVVVSNIMVLKYAAKFKWPGQQKSQSPEQKDSKVED
ncbi:DUF2897 domain-containing protein [Idiomarina tyrosinivorans]|uniref:DUF2897 domain-containing protein n=1 Tax=Idiomarina tyrosinivorans TaxID=1445662 RepID=A0A432ZUD8_9GAMM|nr:DUF2897 domain-containing protein [Idiomarina tyrosinivorans]